MLPGMRPVIVLLLLILRPGEFLEAGFEQFFHDIHRRSPHGFDIAHRITSASGSRMPNLERAICAQTRRPADRRDIPHQPGDSLKSAMRRQI
jgi:hypothetical protein